MDKLQTRRLSDRLVDVTARRPAGFVGRLIYRRAPGHEASFVQVMKWLGPLSGDRCLELGCGGILLERALAAGASSVAGLDHSQEMLTLSRKRNLKAAWSSTPRRVRCPSRR